MTEGTIFNIKRFSVHDGPGIRTSIFLKGCPLRCVWCHNPEGIDREIGIWHNSNTCIGCGECVNACPEKALTLTGTEVHVVSVDRTRCKLSGECVKVCPTGAIDFTGRKISVEELMEEVKKDKLFYEESHGGVTLTGGEPLYQPEFCRELLTACKEQGYHTAIESCLYSERDIVAGLMCLTDLFIADLKIFDPLLHERYTGKGNESIKDNLRFLAANGKELIVRVPLIEGITDSDYNKESIGQFVKELGKNIQVEYLSFNPLTKSKYQRLGQIFEISQ